MDSVYRRIDIYDWLKSKYSEYLKPEIISITMIQSNDGVWLESNEIEAGEGGLEKHTIRRVNLDFIVNESDDAMFSAKDNIENNARRFIEEFSPYSIINTLDLFHEEACNKISKKYNTFGID